MISALLCQYMFSHVHAIICWYKVLLRSWQRATPMKVTSQALAGKREESEARKSVGNQARTTNLLPNPKVVVDHRRQKSRQQMKMTVLLRATKDQSQVEKWARTIADTERNPNQSAIATITSHDVGTKRIATDLLPKTVTRSRNRIAQALNNKAIPVTAKAV